MTRGEKAIWTIVLTLLLIFELRSLIQDRYEHDREQSEVRAEQIRQFREIANDIDRSIAESNGNFKTTLDQQSQHFDATMRQSRISIDEITGGDSYAVVYPDLTPNRANQFPIMVRTCDKCTYSIPNVRIYLVDDRFNNSTPPIYQGNVDPNFALLIPNLAIIPAQGKESEYRITVLARNKPTYETLKVRFNAQSQQWEATWRIVRETKRPRYNPKNRMAEGQEFKVLEDSVWQGNGVTPINPSTIKVIH